MTTHYVDPEFFSPEGLSVSDCQELLESQSWSLLDASFFLSGHSSYYSDRVPDELKQYKAILKCFEKDYKKDCENNELMPGFSDIGYESHFPVEIYMQWAIKYWNVHFPGQNLPLIVTQYLKRQKTLVLDDSYKQIQELRQAGVPIDSLIHLMYRLYRITFADNGEKMLTNQQIGKSKKISNLKANLGKEYPALTSTHLVDSLIRQIREGVKSDK